MCLLQHCISVCRPGESLTNVNAEELEAAYLLHRCRDQLAKAQAANDYLTQYLRSLPPPTPTKVNFALPDKFNGSAEQCKGFIRQVEIFFMHQGSSFDSDDKKCAFLMSLLTGKAIEWAAAVRETDRLFQTSYPYFVKQLRDVFEYTAGGKDVSTRLMQLTQGRKSAAEHAIEFRTIAAQSGWNDVSLKAMFRRSLNMELQAELACKGEDHSFSDYVTLAIKIDNLICTHRPQSKSTSFMHIPQVTQMSESSHANDHASPEPMQLGVTRLSSEERSRRVVQNLCFYCGCAGHHNAVCPLKARRDFADNSRVSVDHISITNAKSLTTIVEITTENDSF
uniref:DUF4939 domain-containing protein n=1 Tax=Cyprinus carpio TaxID=7962 RepID=A0A8C1P7H9_CYPCA